MTPTEVKELLIRELPQLIRQDNALRLFVLDLVQDKFADKEKTEDRIDRILDELQRDREENQRRWDESQRKFEENQRRWDENFAEIKQINRRYDSTIGALGARWGLHSEESFRQALKSILEESFGVEVLNITEYDDEGLVFGRPDQIELDIIIKNGLLIIIEIKSSVSKGDMYIFGRKVDFYEQHHHRQANRKIVISPMVDNRAKPVAERLGIEVYSYADSVPLD